MNLQDIKYWFSKWCKGTKRSGGILIGSSIQELLVDFSADPSRINYSDEYREWLNWKREKCKFQKKEFTPLTTSQHTLIEWLLQNESKIGQIGDVEKTISEVREYVRFPNLYKRITPFEKLEHQ